MWKSLIKFELTYFKNSPIGYINFFLIFVLALIPNAVSNQEVILMHWQTGNSPSLHLFELTNILGLTSLFTILVISDAAIHRDLDANWIDLISTAKINKFDYLFSRFVGPYLVNCVVLLGIPLGLLVGQLIPSFGENGIDAISLKNYFISYFYILLPNAFIVSSILFMLRIFLRKIPPLFLNGFLFFVIFLWINGLISKFSEIKSLGLLNPLGIRLAKIKLENRTFIYQNFASNYFSYELFYNRMIWIILAFILLMITYYFFSFSKFFESKKVLNKHVKSVLKIRFDQTPMPFSSYNFKMSRTKIFTLAHIFYLEIIQKISFITPSFLTAIIFINLVQNNTIFAQNRFFLSASFFINLIIGYSCFFLIILIILFLVNFFKIGKDFEYNIFQYSLPISPSVMILAKYLGLIYLFFINLAFCVLASILLQFLIFKMGLL
jgi:ABC-2 type transport system permease protein